MIVVRDGETSPFENAPSHVAIGVFDGLHLGHQKVIETLLTLDVGQGVPTVVTFDPHPALVLAPARAPRLLQTLDQRLEGLEALGVEQVRLLTFGPELAKRSAHEFIQHVIVDELHAGAVLVGKDFRFGHDRLGDVALLRREGGVSGFEVYEAPTYGEPRWSSTLVRTALDAGDLDTANAVLGRPFVLRGAVEHGDARGRDLGFATANMALMAHQAIPQIGIYAGAARSDDGTWHAAAISIGTRPQFYDDGALLVEVHLPDFSGDLYGEQLDIAFLVRLRGEMKFEDVDALVAQIAVDVEQTRQIFKKFTPSESVLLELITGQRR
jgi:riboflavin kinase / FMN adenylyltransferase